MVQSTKPLKKIVKGLKKASRTHAKQASTLAKIQKAMNGKKSETQEREPAKRQKVAVVDSTRMRIPKTPLALSLPLQRMHGLQLQR